MVVSEPGGCVGGHPAAGGLIPKEGAPHQALPPPLCKHFIGFW